MTDISFNNSLRLDRGLDGISYQARGEIQQSLPDRRELAPTEGNARNRLQQLLAAPNIGAFLGDALRPVLSDASLLAPVRFRRELHIACAALSAASPVDKEQASTLRRAVRTLSDDLALRDLISTYRNALHQG